MAPRLQLHQLLETFTDNVYFQPPENIRLQYPCIIYKRDFAYTEFADDKPYNYVKRYMIMVIDRDPDSNIPEKVAAMPMSLFNRFYTADNLNHDVYNVYF
jgi:hypothetical protein